VAELQAERTARAAAQAEREAEKAAAIKAKRLAAKAPPAKAAPKAKATAEKKRGGGFNPIPSVVALGAAVVLLGGNETEASSAAPAPVTAPTTGKAKPAKPVDVPAAKPIVKATYKAPWAKKEFDAAPGLAVDEKATRAPKPEPFKAPWAKKEFDAAPGLAVDEKPEPVPKPEPVKWSPAQWTSSEFAQATGLSVDERSVIERAEKVLAKSDRLLALPEAAPKAAIIVATETKKKRGLWKRLRGKD
jgi:hypothetical protein